MMKTNLAALFLQLDALGVNLHSSTFGALTYVQPFVAIHAHVTGVPNDEIPQGHVDAFSRGVTRDSFLEARKKVKDNTGIDIEQSPNVDLQAAAVTTISQLFTQGLGFKTHEKRWPKLLAAVRAHP